MGPNCRWVKLLEAAARRLRGFAPRGIVRITPLVYSTLIFRSVGISYIEGTVRGPQGAERVHFLIDSGAMYSLLPDAVWRRIGLTANRDERFSLADGTWISRPVSECHFSLARREGHAPVILGEPNDPEALLGVVTLENLGLVFDPFHRTLHPMRMLLI